MNGEQRFAAARWPTALKIMSAFAVVLLAGVGVAAYRAIPTPTGFTHAFGLGVALVFPAILVGALLFIVRGYAVTPDELAIERLLWSTRVPLAGLERVWLDPSVCRGMMRLAGNGGLFAFSGLYRSARLGRFRLFATDLRHAVVLAWPDRTVVITPAAAEAFVEHLHRLLPGTQAGAGDLSGHPRRVRP